MACVRRGKKCGPLQEEQREAKQRERETEKGKVRAEQSNCQGLRLMTSDADELELFLISRSKHTHIHPCNHHPSLPFPAAHSQLRLLFVAHTHTIERMRRPSFCIHCPCIYNNNTRTHTTDNTHRNKKKL